MSAAEQANPGSAVRCRYLPTTDVVAPPPRLTQVVDEPLEASPEDEQEAFHALCEMMAAAQEEAQ